jgi:flagellar protein FliO/FliZ
LNAGQDVPVEAPSFAAQLGGTALALLLVLALAWVALRGLKRLQQRASASGPGDPIVLLRSTSLGPRERVVAVRYRGREYLLGVTASQVTVIDRHDDAAPPAVDDGDRP